MYRHLTYSSSGFMRLIVVASIVGLCGCASNPSVTRPSTSETIRVGGGGGGALELTTSATGFGYAGTMSHDLAAVWHVLPDVYESFGIPRTTVDKNEYLLGNTGMRIRRQLGKVSLSRYIDCGSTQGGSSADEYDISMSVMTRLIGTGTGQTSMTTAIEATGRPVMFSGEQVRCSTKGVLEKRLFEAVSAQLSRK